MSARRILDAQERCIICNKVVNPATVRMVETTIWGDVIPEGDPRSNGPESQGCFAVGADCYRKVKASGKVWGDGA